MTIVSKPLPLRRAERKNGSRIHSADPPRTPASAPPSHRHSGNVQHENTKTQKSAPPSGDRSATAPYKWKRTLIAKTATARRPNPNQRERSHPAGTRRNNNVFTTSTRRRRRRVDVVKTLSLRHYCVMCPLGGLSYSERSFWRNSVVNIFWAKLW